jgi:RND family efflux transporter MFP subunit
MTVEATTPGFADRTYTGEVTFINSRIDPVMRTVLVRAKFANADDELRPGMSFTVHVELPGEMHPMVPELALQWGRAGAYVWRVTNGKAEQVPVRSVRRRDGFVLVEGDITPGDLVVVEGVQRLRPGRPVLFTDPGNGASAAMTTSAGGEIVR